MILTQAEPLSALIGSAGVAGVVLVLLILGKLHTDVSVQREQRTSDAELARRQAMIDTLLAVYHHEVLPTLSDIDKRLIPMMERNEKLMQQVEWLFGQLERRSGAQPDAYFRSRGGDVGVGGGQGQSGSPDLDPAHPSGP